MDIERTETGTALDVHEAQGTIDERTINFAM
jgi:hypothetical protein